MPGLRLLILSAATQVGQNVLATLAGRRHGLAVIGLSSVANEPALFDLDAVYLAPPTAAEPDAFERRLLDVMERERIDLVIPCRDDDVVFLAGLRDRRPDLAPRLLCGSSATAVAMADKWSSFEFCEAHGLPFAASIIEADDAGRAAFAREHGFPLLAKPRDGWASQGIYLVNDDVQFARALRRGHYIVQQFLGDHQAMADYLAALASEGVPLFHDFQGVKHSIQVLIEPDGATGNAFSMHLSRRMRRSKRVEPDPDPRSLALARRCAAVFSTAGWRGPLNIQCRMAPDGALRIHEFSGRFTGATVDRWLLGFDEVGTAIARFTGATLPFDRTPSPAAVEAFESRIGRAVGADRVAALSRDRMWQRPS